MRLLMLNSVHPKRAVEIVSGAIVAAISGGTKRTVGVSQVSLRVCCTLDFPGYFRCATSSNGDAAVTQPHL